MKYFSELRLNINEKASMVDSAGYKLSNDGRKVKAHRIKVGDIPPQIGDIPTDDEILIQNLKDKLKLKESTEAIVEDPPYLITLKRLNIRLYQGNIKVALYYSEKLNKYFTIAYGKNINAEPMQAEDNGILNTLYNIQENNISQDITLLSDETININKDMADKFISLYEQLDETNKNKMINLIGNDIESFNQIEAFIKDN